MDRHLTNVAQIKSNLKLFMNKYKLEELINKLPKKESMLKILNSCLGTPGRHAWSNIVTKVKESNKSKCYSYNLCNLEMPKHNCVNVKTTWETIRLQSKKFSFSYYKSAEFKDDNKCII